jgi:hypothetical protein
MGLTATNNTIKGFLDGPGSGRPACVGLLLGSASGDHIADNVIDVRCVVQEAGNIQFTPYNGGYNKIFVKAYNTTSATIIGNPATTDDFHANLHNSTGLVNLDNRTQRTALSVAANSSVTWTFPFAFSVEPVVVFSPYAPSGPITSGIWASSMSNTYVTIFNNNAVSMTLNIIAMASV